MTKESNALHKRFTSDNVHGQNSVDNQSPNCCLTERFLQTGWVYWKSGIYLFNLDLCPDLRFYSLFGIQFWLNLHVQLAVLTVIILRFNFVAMFIPELLIFTIAMLLSDLAVPFYPHQLTHSSKTRTDYEENTLQSLADSQDSGLPDSVSIKEL